MNTTPHQDDPLKRPSEDREIRAQRERDILLLALKAGQILLENGAEIFRVEDTVYRICHYYGLHSANVFVLSNGIFLTSGDEKETQFAKVLQIPVNVANLSRVAEVNQLSRQIEAGRFTPEEAKLQLERIENTPGFSNRIHDYFSRIFRRLLQLYVRRRSPGFFLFHMDWHDSAAVPCQNRQASFF